MYEVLRISFIPVISLERTLFRRLANEGITYQRLADEVRFDLAKEMLREQDVTLGEIAVHLGFSDAGNFSRTFRRIGGLSPRQYRKSLETSPNYQT